jgi:hypothetical protein
VVNPYTGETHLLREELFGDAAAPGDRMDMDAYREQVAKLGTDATEAEVAAMRAQALVRVTEQAAHKVILGERERERRRRRRKSERQARKRNR